jgi:hypothetical protein
MPINRIFIFWFVLTIPLLGCEKGYGQSFDYVSFSAGVGSYTNYYDPTLLNAYSPHRNGPELNLLVGRQRRKLGWQAGLTFRDVRYFTLGKVATSNILLFDTLQSMSNTGFLLIPATLQYQEKFGKWAVGLKAGLYVGWKLYASEFTTLSSGPKYMLPVSWSRFPNLDAFGGQAGVEVLRQISPRLSIYLDARLIKDASSLIFSSYHAYTNTYAGYEGRVLTLGTKLVL